MIVPASGAVLTADDKAAMHAAVEKGWLTAGPINAQFEERLGKFTGIRNVRTCNSGSSANLLAVGAMVESGRWKRGDRILAVAAAFPTTVNPLFVYGLVPVFVDVELGSYNPSIERLADAANSFENVRGAMIAHTLGNPFDVKTLVALRLLKSDFWVVEDCCDALGATIDGTHVGNFGAIGTCSFFPAHHITTGEGGAVFTNDDELAGYVQSIRDWGRSCWCEPGRNNTCGKRYEWQEGTLPYGYDHKGICRTLGFNLKGTEIGAACGLSQAGRLDSIVAKRRANYKSLRARFADAGGEIEKRILLPTFGDGASPFGFPITLMETGTRREMQRWLTQEGVDSRTLFSGNITRHPYMVGREWLAASTLEITDQIMDSTFWIGCHPELSEEQLAYSAQKVSEFLGVFA